MRSSNRVHVYSLLNRFHTSCFSLVRSLEAEVRRVREAGQVKGVEMELCTRLLALLRANRK